MAAAVDWTDPCARAAALRSAYFALISGGHEQRVRFRNGDDESEVQFTAPKIEVLRDELRWAEAECTAKNTGGRPGRFCITAG